jgi:glycosyltransferase involved in cell wall biosynthesis
MNFAIAVKDIINCKVIGLDKNYSEFVISRLKKNYIDLEILGLEGFKGLLKAKKIIERSISGNTIIFSSLLRPDLINYLIKKNKTMHISCARDFIDIQYKFNYNFFVGKIIGYLHFEILKKMDYVIVISDTMKEYFVKKKINEEKLIKINNFLDEELIEEMKNGDNVLNYYKIDANRVKFITCSRLSKRKNIFLLLNVFKELKKLGFKFYFFILGQGELFSKIESFIKENNLIDSVFLVGQVNNPIPAILSSDFYISASLAEGLSRSVMEALYLGKFCILSNIEGHRELITEGKNGILFNSYDQLKNILIDIISNNLRYDNKNNLLPIEYSMNYNKNRFRTFIESIIR